MLLMVEKGIIGETGHAIRGQATANNKCIKKYYKNNKSSCISMQTIYRDGLCLTNYL